jgi:hypothetical protein
MKKSDNDSQDSVNSHSFADRLEDRLIDFAVRIIVSCHWSAINGNFSSNGN